MNLLFSLTKKDFEIQTFCTGGPGGQHKNAKQNGVRIIHKASGAVAQEVCHREQYKNKEFAFKKLVNTKEFKTWHKLEVSRRLGYLQDIDKKVDAMMKDIKIEEYSGIV